jgi:hypothetical protein
MYTSVALIKSAVTVTCAPNELTQGLLLVSRRGHLTFDMLKVQNSTLKLRNIFMKSKTLIFVNAGLYGYIIKET